MNKLAKLKAIQKAYYALIPCVKNNAIQDYALVLSDAPIYLKDLIEEEEKYADTVFSEVAASPETLANYMRQNDEAQSCENCLAQDNCNVLDNSSCRQRIATALLRKNAAKEKKS